MNRNDRKELAQETLRILEAGVYEIAGKRVTMAAEVEASTAGSRLLLPEEGRDILAGTTIPPEGETCAITLRNQSTLEAVFDMKRRGCEEIGVLNFASAKNPGGGFLGGSLAQEESLALASSLYLCQLQCPGYYESNRACGTMAYTDHAIYSPKVVFFREDSGALLERPVTASVLTLPAVNYGQVLRKGEDTQQAKETMRRRMELTLAIFAHMGYRDLVLGAYGCGVFRNEPRDVARWWRELLDKGYQKMFRTVVFAVLDRSGTGENYRAFDRVFGAGSEGAAG